LPPFWTDKRWAKLGSQEQTFVVNAVTSFEFFFHYVFLPWQSVLDREVWMPELPAHWHQICQKIEYTIPPAMVPYTHSVRPDSIYRAAFFEPTGVGKSTLVVRAFPLWAICLDPNLSVLLGTSTVSLGERHIGCHQDHLTRNELLLKVFGPQHSQDSDHTWKATKIAVDGKFTDDSGNVEALATRVRWRASGTILGSRTTW